MHFQRYWSIYVLLGIGILSGCFYGDIQLLLKQKKALALQCRELALKLNEQKEIRRGVGPSDAVKGLKKISALEARSYLMSGLENYANTSRLRLELLRFSESEDIDHESNTLKLVLIGEYQTLLQFLRFLQTMKIPLHILNFQVKSERQRLLKISVHLVFFKVMTQHQRSQPYFGNKPTTSPFCTGFIGETTEALAKSTPVRQMLMVGYLAGQDGLSALVQLPTKQILITRRGAYLGKEKAEIVALSAHGMTLQMSNKQQFTLRCDPICGGL